MNEKDKREDNDITLQHFSFLEKKAERISSVLYTLTDFFDDREELKWKLRNRSITLLSFMRTLGGENRDPAGAPTITETVGVMREIRILLSLAEETSLISSMNSAVISREVRMLEDKLRAYVRYRGLVSVLPVQQSSNALKDKKHRSIKDTVYPQKDKQKRQTQTPSPTQTKAEKIERREAIKDFLKASSPATIKDIIKVISGASEKTIQRELTTLVNEGVVQKTGKRRWTRYYLP